MKCLFCGKPAGFLKREHAECRAVAENGKKYLRECIDYIYSNRDCMNISEVVDDTIRKFNIPQATVRKLFLECWNAKVMDAFSDGVVEADEIKILKEMLTALNIDGKRLSKSKQWRMLVDYGSKEIEACLDAAVKAKDLSHLEEQVYALADSFGVSTVATKKYAFEYWKQLWNNAFEDGLLTEDEEQLLDQLANVFKFSESEVAPYQNKIVKAAILRDVFNGILPHRCEIVGQLPIMLQKSESIIWACSKVPMYENKIRRHYVGGSSGVSVRIAKGVYLRSGAFRGKPVETTESECIGNGNLFITNKAIFWVSPEKSIKILKEKLISVIPLPNGVILQKDGVRASPLTLILDDPCFIYNLISNLNIIP